MKSGDVRVSGQDLDFALSATTRPGVLKNRSEQSRTLMQWESALGSVNGAYKAIKQPVPAAQEAIEGSVYPGGECDPFQDLAARDLAPPCINNPDIV